jgi:hypothetical protein
MSSPVDGCIEAAVMRRERNATLAFSAASPADQAIYDEARALLAEHGRVGVPVEMVEAHREWEGRR